MFGFKAVCLSLAVFAIVSAAQNVPGSSDPKAIVISEKWMLEHGCPSEKVPLFVECNRCDCFSPKSKLAACTLKACNDNEVIDDWQDGVACKPGKHFFTKCSHCLCNEDGTSAECDNKACQYY